MLECLQGEPLHRVRAAVKLTYPQGVRSAVVHMVDVLEGYAMEFAPSPAAHRTLYDNAYVALMEPWCPGGDCPVHGGRPHREDCCIADPEVPGYPTGWREVL
jgi:hypothetical protein